MDSWLLLQHPPLPPAWNMACDEWLLNHIQQFENPILRIYGWDRPSITIGYFQQYPEAHDASFTVIRRPTGGALVDHSEDLTFTVILPPNHPWKGRQPEERYQVIHERIHKIFENRGLTPSFASKQKADLPHPSGRNPSHSQCFIKATRYDVLIGLNKVAGGAQRCNRIGLLHQGSIQGGGQPKVTPLELCEAWKAFGSTFSPLTLSPESEKAIQDFSRTKYETNAWNKKF